MKNNILLTGIGASPGIVISRVFLVDHSGPEFTHFRLTTEDEIFKEKDRLTNAIADSKTQLEKTRKEIGRKGSKEAQYIIDTHILILQDKLLKNDTLEKIKKAGYKTVVLDMSEFRKLDGGLSCLSLRF